MNEGACDPDGRFYCGSMAHDKRPGAGALHRLDPDGSVHVVLTGVTVSNGLGWSPDGTRAYYNDTDSYGTDVFDYEPGAGLTSRRRFVDTGALRPDGLTVDAEGGVWIALSNGGAVQPVRLRRRPRRGDRAAGHEGHRLHVRRPAASISSSSRRRAKTSTPDDEPRAGSLFRAVPGVTGLPVLEFAG